MVSAHRVAVAVAMEVKAIAPTILAMAIPVHHRHRPSMPRGRFMASHRAGGDLCVDRHAK